MTPTSDDAGDIPERLDIDFGAPAGGDKGDEPDPKPQVADATEAAAPETPQIEEEGGGHVPTIHEIMQQLGSDVSEFGESGEGAPAAPAQVAKPSQSEAPTGEAPAEALPAEEPQPKRKAERKPAETLKFKIIPEDYVPPPPEAWAPSPPAEEPKAPAPPVAKEPTEPPKSAAEGPAPASAPTKSTSATEDILAEALQELEPSKAEQEEPEAETEAKDNTPKKPRKKVRGWIPVAGVVLAGVAFYAGPIVFKAPPPPPELTDLRLVVASEPPSEVYRGEEHLGTTPLVVVQKERGENLSLRLPGFVTQGVGYHTAREHKVGRVMLKLPFVPIPMDWSGLSEGAEVVWDGKVMPLDRLKDASPTEHDVLINLGEGPPVHFKVVLEPVVGGAAPQTLEIGKKFLTELGRRRALNLALAVPLVTPPAPPEPPQPSPSPSPGAPKPKPKPKPKPYMPDITVSVALEEVTTEVEPYKTNVSIGTKVTTDLVVPRGGKYRLTFGGSDDYGQRTEEIEVTAEGGGTSFVFAIEAPSTTPEATPTPQASATPVVAASPTPAPSATPATTATPAATASPAASPSPVATPEPSPTVSATPEASPTAAPTPAASPQATSTPATSPSPSVSATPQATPSPGPTPTVSATPAATPAPVATPSPSAPAPSSTP